MKGEPLTGAQPAPAAPEPARDLHWLIDKAILAARRDAANPTPQNMVKASDARVAAINAALTAPAAQPADSAMDSERLDFIADLHDFKVSANYQQPDGPVLFRIIKGDNRIGAGPSLRAAIDTARALTAASKERSKTHE